MWDANADIIDATGATGILAAEIDRRWTGTRTSIEGLMEWALAVGLREPWLVWARELRGTDALVCVHVEGRPSSAPDFGLRRAYQLVESAVHQTVRDISPRYRHATAGGRRREAQDRARVEAAYRAALATWAVLAADAIARYLTSELWRTASLVRYMGRGYTVGPPRAHYGEWEMDRSRPVSQAARLRQEQTLAERQRRLDAWRPRLLAITVSDVRASVRDRYPAGSSDTPRGCTSAVNCPSYLLGILCHGVGIEEYRLRPALPRWEDVEADLALAAHARELWQWLFSAASWDDLAA